MILLMIMINISRSIGAIVRKSLQLTIIDEKLIGRVTGFISTISLGVNAISPVIGGWLSEFVGIHIALFFVITIFIIASFMMILLRK